MTKHHLPSDAPEPPFTRDEIVTWDENHQPLSTLFNDVYFSRENGLEETRFVFLEQNCLRERWQTLQQNDSFFIAEAGFGTGLNFLASWQLWTSCVTPDSAHLHFFSVEKYPLEKQELAKALALWPELAVYTSRLLKAWPPSFIEGIHKLEFPDVTLSLFFGDIVEGLEHLLPNAEAGPLVREKETSFGRQRPQIDAWFLDGFAPAKNPLMWRPQIFQLMAQLSRKNASFATFTSAGEVRRGLQTAGFHCKKIKGFGNKREMLCGSYESHKSYEGAKQTTNLKNETTSPTKKHNSWYLVAHAKAATPVQSAIVVGGGLAGCHTAYALARRGIKVTLIEQASALASDASANRRAVLYTRLSPETGPLNRFNLSALLYACRFYANEKLFATAGSQCGVLHLVNNEKEQQHFHALAKLFSAWPEILQYCSKEKSSELAGFAMQREGLFVPAAGWLDPVKVCHELSRHTNIQTRVQTTVNKFSREHTRWTVQTTSAENFEADVLILANARQANHFPETRHLPLKSIRGQVTYLSELPSCVSQPATVICGEGYMTAYAQRGLCVGASFNLHSNAAEISDQDQRDNIQRFSNTCPEYVRELEKISVNEFKAQVGFRCTTPDYFPVVGPMPQVQDFAERFQGLSKNANAPIDECGAYYPGLFCLTGLGSRGLAYAPLAANAVASCMLGEPLPFSNDLWLHLHPARFLIRSLVRNHSLSGLD